MSKKKKVTKGNPAKSANTSSVEAIIRTWADNVIVQFDEKMLIQIALAMTAWVGAGNPTARGFNQCLSACGIVRTFLAAMGVQANIVTVRAQVRDTATLEVLDTVGTLTPDLSQNSMSWSGHAILHIPSAHRVLDPTFSQSTWARNAGMPLVLGRVLQGTPSPGGIWSMEISGLGARVEYEILSPQFDPLNDRGVNSMLSANAAALAPHMPNFLASVQEVMTIKGL